jgi:hypothetical protein
LILDREGATRNEQKEKQLRESTKIKPHPQISTQKSHANTGDAHSSLSRSLLAALLATY